MPKVIPVVVEVLELSPDQTTMVAAGGSGLVVIAYDNGLTIDSGSAQVTLSGDVTKLSNLDITSSYDGSTISGIVSGLTPITYTGPTAGELIVSADNTFTGNVNVISGALSHP